MTNNDKRRIREARRALREAKCTCSDRHDPYWMRCPRAEAEWQFDNALAQVGLYR